MCVLFLFWQILSKKPDACIKSLDLSQLSLNYAYAFKEFGDFQDESSYQILASALNIMDKM
jgi:hypothetical protein